MFQENHTGFEIDYPELSIDYQYQLKYQEQSIILEDEIKQQYINLQFLGNDILEDYFVDNYVFENLILFVNSNYIPINYYELIVENPVNCQLYGRMLYQIFVVDLLNYILPKICEEKSINAIDLYGFEEFKSSILNTIKNKSELLRELLLISPDNTDVKYDLLKYTFAMDLFDNNLEDFIENYIYPIIDLYETEINIKVNNV